MGEILLVRHGQAECNQAGIVAGPSCTGLTEGGRSTAGALGARLRSGRPIDALHSSSTRRAAETAAIIGAASGMDIHIEPALRVPDPGFRDGQRWETIRAAAAEGYPIEAAESWTDYLGRATRCLDDILCAHPAGRVVVVGHAETVTAMFVLLLGNHELGSLGVNLDYGAITAFRTVRARGITTWELLCHNDTAHVPAHAPRYPGHREP